jgi:hypothetical protein
VGTDTDYLETSRLRGIFRENAILDADVTLFEMQADQHDLLNIPGSPLDLEFRSRSWLHQLIYIPPTVVLIQMSVPLQLFHQTKFYFFTLIVIGLLVFIIFRIDRA